MKIVTFANLAEAVRVQALTNDALGYPKGNELTHCGLVTDGRVYHLACERCIALAVNLNEITSQRISNLKTLQGMTPVEHDATPIAVKAARAENPKMFEDDEPEVEAVKK